ncbi:hypothetical protein AVEN_221089-1, partial [Araneus ventricosus]
PKTEGVPNMKFISSLKSPETASSGNASSSSFQSGYNRIEEVAELNHLLANVTSLLHHHLSVYRKEYGKRRYRPDHQLEELRNIQEKLSQERLQWEQEKAKKEKELEKKQQELIQMECSNNFEQHCVALALAQSKIAISPLDGDHIGHSPLQLSLVLLTYMKYKQKV